VRQLDPAVAASRDLRMYCYSLDARAADAIGITTQEDTLRWMQNSGIPVHPGFTVVDTLKKAEGVYEKNRGAARETGVRHRRRGAESERPPIAARPRLHGQSPALGPRL
jgi:NAD-dependent DNA ligase